MSALPPKKRRENRPESVPGPGTESPDPRPPPPGQLLLGVRADHDAGAAEARVRGDASFVAWNPGIDSRVPGGHTDRGGDQDQRWAANIFTHSKYFPSPQPASAAHIAIGGRQLAAAPRPARPQETDSGVSRVGGARCKCRLYKVFMVVKVPIRKGREGTSR